MLHCRPALEVLAIEDEREAAGIRLVRDALAAPLRQLVRNAGVARGPVLAELAALGPDHGYDVLRRRTANMWAAGIVDATEVVRVALQTAVSVTTTAHRRGGGAAPQSAHLDYAIGSCPVPRKVRVLTTSGFPSPGSNVEQNRELAARYVEAAGRQGADLVCLPETFLNRGGMPEVEPIPGPTFNRLAELARAYRIWVVAGYCVRAESGAVENSAVVIDREGELAARHAKVHPTIGECEDRGITPGGQATMVETDFGRVGLAICYDIGWPAHWAELSRLGAELVVWPSAYDGGFPLRAYAWTHFYYIVSSVHGDHGKVIDITGEVIASTSHWHHVTTATIDLEKEVFHTDGQEEKLLRIQLDRGEGVTARGFSEENVFTLESNDDEWPLARLKRHYGLESFRDYHARAERVQDEHRRRGVQAAAGGGGVR